MLIFAFYVFYNMIQVYSYITTFLYIFLQIKVAIKLKYFIISMSNLLLKAINFVDTLKKIYQSFKKILVPLIADYRRGIIPKWSFFKMIVKQTYVILLEAGLVQFVEHIIVTFILPGIGWIIVDLIQHLTQKKTIQAIQQSIHKQLDKYQSQYSDKIVHHEHKPTQVHHGIYNKVLKQLKLKPNVEPNEALKYLEERKAELESDPQQSIWEHLKLYKKEMIIRAYSLQLF